MNWAKTLRRWTMRTIHATILGSALVGSASIASAQLPASAASKLPGIHYTRSQTFDLPVVMSPKDRSQLSEIRLYVKTPTTAWTIQERGTNELTRFSCKVAQDGEYWYTLALVDLQGRQSPPDVNLELPTQRVVVDTTAPVVQVQAWNADGDFCLRCSVQDAHPDQATLKAVCRTPTGDVQLEMVSNQPGVFRAPRPEHMHYPVVVSAMDLAGNAGSKEVNVREMVQAALAPGAKAASGVSQAGGGVDTKLPPRVDPLPPPRFDPLPPPADLPMKSGGPREVVQTQKVEFPPPPSVGTIAPGNPLAPSDGGARPIQPQPIETVAHHGTPHHLINSTHANVEYRIDQVGPSGVGKVEIWMTPDKGQSWHRLMEHAARRSPAEIDLPGDGVYGIRVVVTNGNGFGGKAPIKGDAPHYTLEVDTTAPFVQLRSAEVLPSSGQVELRWNATDKNLGTEPVSLFYRTRTDGPWQLIAAKVKNDGVHRWAFPRDAGAQFYFKVEVADQAGNLAQAASSQPVLIDITEPRATVVGVTGSAAALRP